MSDPAPSLPYKIACLCDLRDQQGRVLLLHRVKPPNFDLCSPIGGKLDMHLGESPTENAQREIMEEAGIDLPLSRLALAGMISEKAFEGRGHWLIFYYRVLGAVWVEPQDTREGRLDWHRPEEVEKLPLPETDRKIIWPLIRTHAADYEAGKAPRPAFFSVHIDCSGPKMTWVVDQSELAGPGAAAGLPWEKVESMLAASANSTVR
jgi:8-oxo-dGTP diphosphatase